MSESHNPDAGSGPTRDDPQALEHIRHALRGLRYGEVTVVVQDGVVVQVERLERKRLERKSRKREGR
jgi:hypothetical protein